MYTDCRERNMRLSRMEEHNKLTKVIIDITCWRSHLVLAYVMCINNIYNVFFYIIYAINTNVLVAYCCVCYLLSTSTRIFVTAEQFLELRTCIYSQTCLKGNLYISNHCLLRAASFSPLMYSAYNFNLYIKGNCSYRAHF